MQRKLVASLIRGMPAAIRVSNAILLNISTNEIYIFTKLTVFLIAILEPGTSESRVLFYRHCGFIFINSCVVLAHTLYLFYLCPCRKDIHTLDLEKWYESEALAAAVGIGVIGRDIG